MTDDEIAALLEDGGQVPVPYFDGRALTVHYFGDFATEELVPVMRNFLSLDPERRERDGRHLVAYCEMMVDAVGPEMLEDMGGEVPTAERIWDHVRPHGLGFSVLDAGRYADRRTVFAVVEGEVAWEPEHGLLMSWADGNRLVRVSEYDGHPTNGHASANPDKDTCVFACYKPELCTTPDP